MNIEFTPKNAETLAKYAALAAHAQKKAISSQFVMKLLLFLTFTLCAVKGMAQMPNPYDPSINLENAKKAAAPALAEARKNNWTMAVTITKAFEDVLAAGGDGLRVLGLHAAVPVEGGIPLLIDGNIVGAIGVSGGTAPQDGQCAKAGADDFK